MEIMTDFGRAEIIPMELGTFSFPDDELPGLQSEWVALLDKRTDPICKALGGKRVKVGGTFPGGLVRPPAHARCRCRLVAYLPSWPDDPFPVGEPH